MSWYVIDAVDRALERTRTCLIDPFNFWKWVKLAIITFFIGFGSGFNGGGNNYGGSGSDYSSMPSGLGDFGGVSVLPIIIGVILLIIIIALVIDLIRSIMEYVFVESLVSNDAHIISYASKYMGKALSLFILRLIIGIIAVVVIGILVLLGLMAMGLSFSDVTDFSFATMILGSAMFLVFIALIIAIMLIISMLTSLINLAIPVSMYSDNSIFSALSQVLGQFRRDWQQIVIYWIGRIILSIIVGIIMFFIAVIAILVTLIPLAILDILLYVVFEALISDAVWFIMIPVLILEFIFFILFMALVGMPAKVFMKYHMLTFLQKWYPIDLPMFDRNFVTSMPENEWLD